ncbi:outer membrane beta-barrel protein [Gemmatimonas sp. UBA7669]|uniref:outer membrane beta-barrel protein n=1 Tax=Gemmatimonas sp. UBA7669 TaxID=1946568 RepID=UPI0025BB7A6F|nr:outer membrane beta-barrel protein [Gemmatimonas sp. UBA7669]
MTRHSPSLFALAAAAVLAIPSMASAQATGPFEVGSKVGSIGFMAGGDYEGAGLGVQGEVGFKKLGNTVLGLGGFVGIQRDSETVFGSKYTSTVIPIMAIGNVHFPIASQPKLDLFAGASLGFVSVNVEVEGTGLGDFDAGDSDIGFGIQGGARYNLSNKLSLMGQVGVGDIPLIFAGVSIKF